MTQVGWTTRLRSVLGAAPEDLDWTQLEQLVGSVVEAEDLDFKRDLYGNGDSDKQELAADVASFANHRGGLLLIGIDEADGVASALAAVALSDGEEARMRQIIASRLSPFLDYELRPIPNPEQPDTGCYALLVAPSPGRPHAVLSGTKLAYPRRDGTTTRWLSEAEVADLYGERFRGDTARVARATQAVNELIADLDTEEWPWLVISVVPGRSSSFEIDHAAVQRVQEWAGRFRGDDLLTGAFDELPRAAPAMRRLVLSSHYEPVAPFSYDAAHLHTDGVAAVAQRFVWRADTERETAVIFRDHLVASVTAGLHLAVSHAIENCTGYGEAVVEARLIANRPMSLCFLEHGHFLNAVPGTRAIDGPIITEHSFRLEALDQPQELLAAARVILSDFMHAFGSAEVPHLASDGTVRVRAFNRPDQIRQWAEARQIPASED